MSENIIVAIRSRPSKKNIESKYNFDYFFQNSSQEQIFETIAKNPVEWVCQGYNSSIFAYGQTSSGKTHTMFGTSENEGIIPRACKLLFSYENRDVVEKTIKCSFLEIYKENLKDLFRKDNNELKIRQTPAFEIYVQGLSEKKVNCSEELLNLVYTGLNNRKTASTSCNSQSSRSHAVLSIIVNQKFNDNTEITGKLNLVDLAGSENVSKSEVQGLALTEAQNINKSLLILGNVINSLSERRSHIPYRDSKLTYLLKDSLGGNSKTIIIGTINPDNENESNNTIKFCRRAKEIKNIPKINKKSSINELQQKIKLLELENERLKNGNMIFDQQMEYQYLDQIDDLNIIFDRQRDFSNQIREELEGEKKKNISLCMTIEKYKVFYKNCKDIVQYDKPNLSRLINIIKSYEI